VVAGPEGAPASGQYLENLSHRGALIRTSDPCPTGTPVRVTLPLPHGESVDLPATVVHQRREGIGVKFEDDRAGLARLNATITEMVGANRRVLVIDDDELARRILTDALQERGLEVVAEKDALAGLQRLAEEIFTLDLLITDVMMPGVDGEELIRRIRQVGGERDLPILAVTASLEDALTRRLRLAGADAAVSKSLGPAGLADAAEALLRSRTSTPPETAPGDDAALPAGVPESTPS
jgi:CheY-like chemotaxis protein